MRVGGGNNTTGRLRVLVAERSSGVHSGLAKRAERSGHEVLATVTGGTSVVDQAQLLRPDIVLIAPSLDDGPGLRAAVALTAELPDVGAVLLTTHPAAMDPAARPNWGSIVVLPATTDGEELSEALSLAVANARELALSNIGHNTLAMRPMIADARPATSVTERTPTAPPSVPAGEQAARRAVAKPAAATQTAPAVKEVDLADVVSAPRAKAGPVATGEGASQVLAFSDDDLMSIGPFLEEQPVAAEAPASASVVAAALPMSYDEEIEVIAQAAECLLERTGLSRSEAMRLMEQEAADSGQTVAEVARGVIGSEEASAQAAEAPQTA